MPAPQSSTEKKTLIQKQIAELHEKMKLIDAEAIHELKLKLSDARKVVKDLETEVAKLSGEPVSGEPKVKRQRRASISDDILKDQLLKMMAAFGKEGMNAKQMAQKMNLDPIRIRKFITDHKQLLKRTGAGPGTKFFLP